jgi:hypothetical protein
LGVSKSPLFEIFYLVSMEGFRVVWEGRGGLTGKATAGAKAKGEADSSAALRNEKQRVAAE